MVGRDSEGDVTRSLVPRSPCPVAIAPPGARLPAVAGLARIGVAYDGSPAARSALIVARQLVLATGAHLDVLAAGPTAEHARTWLQIARLSIGRRVRFATRALAGDPRDALSAASTGLDLLVCGSRGLRRPIATMLGSVSAHLTTHAECPILVVSPGVELTASWPLGGSDAT